VNNKILDWIRDNTPRTVSLLIRHAHRFPIPKGVIKHQNVPLTQKGRKLAFAFGKTLPLSYSLRLFHSPVPRCKETAEYVLKGFQSSDGVAKLMGEKEFLLIHLVDQREMVRILDEIGHQQFGYRWLKGQFDETIIANPDRVASTMIKGVIRLMENAGEQNMDIHITHDLNILSVRDFISPVPDDTFDWPAYLDGIIFTQNEETVTLIQRQFSKTIEHSWLNESQLAQ
jgi:hypothetical protein